MPAPRYTAAATTILERRLGSAIDPTLIAEIVLALITALAKCYPKPEDAYAYLTWQPTSRWWDFLPWVRTLEERLYVYRQKINALIAQLWKWVQADRTDVMIALWGAVDAGELTPTMLAGLYGEARQ